MQALRSLFARCINRMRIVVSSFLLLMDVMFKSFWSLKSSLLASANDISNVSVAGSDNRDLSSLEHSDNIPSDVNLIPLLYCQNSDPFASSIPESLRNGCGIESFYFWYGFEYAMQHCCWDHAHLIEQQNNMKRVFDEYVIEVRKELACVKSH